MERAACVAVADRMKSLPAEESYLLAHLHEVGTNDEGNTYSSAGPERPLLSYEENDAEFLVVTESSTQCDR